MPSPNNLPLQLTSFIGREDEIAEVKRLLSTSRLLTLTGPGGSGKTRLALQTASQLLDEYPDGVFFVNLAPITDPNLVAPSIARALNVIEVAGEPLAESLKSYLHNKELLLLLDNFEHVVDASPLVLNLLLSAPKLKVLVTSREPLHLQGEQLYEVHPLQLPDVQEMRQPPDDFTRNEAVRLFVERAQSISPDFRLTSDNADAVVEICTRLDGLPLAIELAASRIKLFTPQAMLARLDRRLPFLIGGAKDLPSRQQTLRSAMEWSYDLLSDGEKKLFRRLAVFQGGRTLEAIEAVCKTEGDPQVDVLEAIGSLVSQSLLRQREGSDGEPRFWMLETIHEYARENLRESQEESEMRRQHLAYFMLLAEGADEQIEGPEQETWMKRLAGEHDNFRASLTWALEAEPGLALRLALRLARFWYLSGYLSEGRRWLEKALAQDATAQRLESAVALNHLGTFAWGQGNYEEAASLHSQSLSLSQEIGDKHTIANALLGIGAAKRWLGHYEESVLPLENSLALFREVGDKRGIAMVLNRLGLVASDHGELQRAVMLLEESVALSREIGSKSLLAAALNNLGSVLRTQGKNAQAMLLFEESLLLLRGVGARIGIVQPLVNLAVIALREGNHRQAEPLLKEGLQLSWDIGRKGVVAWCLLGLAGLASAQVHCKRAARLYGSLSALNEPIPPALRAEYERDLALARARLDAAAWMAAWAEGQAMSIEQAIAYALEEVPEPELGIQSLPPSSPYPYELTRREVELLRLLVEGLTNEQIAERLFLSPNTVRAHLHSIYSKIDVGNRGAAARFAVEHGII